MKLPIAIHKDDGTVYGVTVPDVAGCHSFGDTLEEAVTNARLAVVSHVETLLELGETVDIQPSKLDSLVNQEGFKGAIWALIDIDVAELDSSPERVNISLPRFVLRKLDRFVASRHETRSGFLARVALAEMAREVVSA